MEMAFDGFKKMADGVPDYLEVPVTEDGLLEKATAAIHALGYDMEEAISIFLRRIVQTVPSAADLAQAEEFIRKTADTALDDLVTQPLLIPKRDVFDVELLDYATPGFCTHSKPYFGTLEDIAAFRNALYRDEKCKLEDMSFAPVKVYGAKQKARDAGMHEHTNIWGYPYFVWWDRLESVHLWVGSGGRFDRCVRARMKNLKYGTDENAAMSQSPSGQIWGYPHVLEYRHPFHFNRMYVIETRFDSEKEMMDDQESFDGSIELSGWLDELFGDG